MAHQPAHAWRRRYPLDNFSRPDSDRFLNSWSGNELPADLAAAIFGLAKGHPLLTEMAAEIWRYAFIKRLPSGGWSFHELMRDVQLAYLAEQDDPEIEAGHRRAVRFFGGQAEKSGGSEAARNLLYHMCFLEPAAAFGRWQDALFEAQLAGERAWWAELLAVMESPAQRSRLDPLQQGSLLRERGLWYVRDYNMTAALASYEAALPVGRLVCCPEPAD